MAHISTNCGPGWPVLVLPRPAVTVLLLFLSSTSLGLPVEIPIPPLLASEERATPQGHSASGVRRSWLESVKYSAVHDRAPVASRGSTFNGIGEKGDAWVSALLPEERYPDLAGFTRVSSVCSTCAPPADGGGLDVTGADLDGGNAATTLEDCAEACGRSGACVSFSWAAGHTPGACSLHQNSQLYTVCCPIQLINSHTQGHSPNQAITRAPTSVLPHSHSCMHTIRVSQTTPHQHIIENLPTTFTHTNK